MKVPKTSVFEYLNYQMFTKKKIGTTKVVACQYFE